MSLSDSISICMSIAATISICMSIAAIFISLAALAIPRKP